ncbi:uncharacterized protein AMSG_07788 [Thecamonas trahens ATCC 50062]|uniref:Protein phosphatase n=1 Tax=Thecamonas trahens ATCC 50062 TaxID=461836 RepID=A0A0L0DK34_THETB|nr:hypothetical protein AMSG_07788 [Thecamonas trahens ATCC 50062]KNC51718.1 hypothetical protein AMSG_07788 [Thecamonas trahens ATCC 50062]|eukprot:XP_013755847.1 hypothetical protein AMSG_07788 [Thecamonas trahens ATCC 50062]
MGKTKSERPSARRSPFHLATGAMTWSKTMQPHSAGDDHYFVSRSARAYGVFDGVSGSNGKYGTGAAEEAANFMCFNAYAAAHKAAARRRPVDPAAIIIKAHKRLARLASVRGSTTALVAALHWRSTKSALLTVANLGDCGVLIVRPYVHPPPAPASGIDHGSTAASSSASVSASALSSDPYSPAPSSSSSVKLVGFTEPMRHDSGMAHPHTLSATTRHIDRKIDRTAFVVQPGDIVVFGTDGLFDNVDNNTIVSALTRHATASPHFLAKLLARLALHGPKPDDITVLVGRVYEL